MNKIRKLRYKRGFTLVECVVAIAVFALLVTVVLMIVANASNTSKRASDSETQLNTLVQNVVADNSKIKYDSATSDYLNFKVSYSGMADKELTISYNEISGYKNFMKCDSCGYIADSSEFMGSKTKSTFTSTDHYVCPKCAVNVTLSVECDSCGKTVSDVQADVSSATPNFYYNPSNGGYTCRDCGGGYVHDVNYSAIVADASTDAFSISGISPNAVRYGSAAPPDNKTELFDGTWGTDDYNIKIGYTSSPIHSSYDTYEIEITTDSGDPFGSGRVLRFPKNYIAEITSNVVGSATFTETANNWNVVTLESSTNKVQFKFTLNNVRSNTSYDSDYRSEGGLRAYWLGIGTPSNSVNTGTYPADFEPEP